MFTLDKDKYPFPPMDMDKEWLDKKIKLDNEVDYSVYAEPINIYESIFKKGVQDDPTITLRTKLEKDYIMEMNRIKEFISMNYNYIKTRKWYIDNENITNTIKVVNDAKNINNRLIKMYTEIINLYLSDVTNHEILLDYYREKLRQRVCFNRDTFIDIIKHFDSNLKIRDAIEELILKGDDNAR